MRTTKLRVDPGTGGSGTFRGRSPERAGSQLCKRGMNEVNDGETAPKPPIGELMGTEHKTEDNSRCLVRLSTSLLICSNPELRRVKASITRYSHLKRKYLEKIWAIACCVKRRMSLFMVLTSIHPKQLTCERGV